MLCHNRWQTSSRVERKCENLFIINVISFSSFPFSWVNARLLCDNKVLLIWKRKSDERWILWIGLRWTPSLLRGNFYFIDFSIGTLKLGDFSSTSLNILEAWKMKFVSEVFAIELIRSYDGEFMSWKRDKTTEENWIVRK